MKDRVTSTNHKHGRALEKKAPPMQTILDTNMNTKHKSKACTDALHAGSGGSQAQTQAPVSEKSPAGKKKTKDAKSRTCVKSARKQTGETCAMPHAAKGSGTEASEAQSVREGTNPDPLATKPDTVSDSLIGEYAWKLIDQKIPQAFQGRCARRPGR